MDDIHHFILYQSVWSLIPSPAIRYPLRDVPLLELAYNMPPLLKMHSGMERYMFRRILEGVTTPRNQCRAKADVNHPPIDRTQDPGREQLFEQIQNSPLAKQYYEQTKLAAIA